MHDTIHPFILGEQTCEHWLWEINWSERWARRKTFRHLAIIPLCLLSYISYFVVYTFSQNERC